MQAPLSEDKDHDEEDLCIVCWEELREVIFYHCMHMVRSCHSGHPFVAMVNSARDQQHFLEPDVQQHNFLCLRPLHLKCITSAAGQVEERSHANRSCDCLLPA